MKCLNFTTVTKIQSVNCVNGLGHQLLVTRSSGQFLVVWYVDTFAADKAHSSTCPGAKPVYLIRNGIYCCEVSLSFYTKMCKLPVCNYLLKYCLG